VTVVNAVKDQTDNMQYKIHSLNDDEIRVKRVRSLFMPLDVPVTVGWSAAVSAYHPVLWRLDSPNVADGLPYRTVPRCISFLHVP